jgi:UDP-N-acetylmuramate: L-alanyl-gamma-D-glutamyl-meso-diaminopimelate ligase
MRIHFIAIGGAVMHNLALALQKKGFRVTGSDDEIFEPSRSRLEKAGLLPEKEGWDRESITRYIDVVILGMHARPDNPELLRAQELGLQIKSFPEFLYEQTLNKTRVVIGGSHGKTTITSMIMHVLRHHGVSFDYMVGSAIEGFETMVGFSESSEIAVFEGDEYLASTLDRRPKFHLYKPHIAVISGIAWDHMNVFPTWEDYLGQFRIFIDKTMPGGSLIYSRDDKEVTKLVEASRGELNYVPYHEHPSRIIKGKTYLIHEDRTYPVSVFGRHNMQNISAAISVCELLGISPKMFYQAIQGFKGAAKRMQLLEENRQTAVYLDFAHAPSKVEATTLALKEQYPERWLTAVLELHTYSSLSADFLPQYEATMLATDKAIVYFSPNTVAHKKLPEISVDQVKAAFKQPDLWVYTDAEKLVGDLINSGWKGSNLLIMTSGNFDGQDLSALARSIIHEDD